MQQEDAVVGHEPRVADGYGGEDRIDGRRSHAPGAQHDDVQHVGDHAEHAQRDAQRAVEGRVPAVIDFDWDKLSGPIKCSFRLKLKPTR